MRPPWVVPLADLTADDRPLAGGKATVLGELTRAGLRVPAGICLPTYTYRAFVDGTGLAGRIEQELGRKRFEDMRWEEIWDTALRIRNVFLKTPWPLPLRDALLDQLAEAWPEGLADTPVAVRSSAPGEDDRGSSFAGLHESIVNVRGPERTLEAVRKVWASLWSDRALLYRQELGLDVETSAMAVVVQEMVLGRCSGVAFSQSPTDPRRAVVEAVWGLNEGLVDGTVEPDHWEIDRDGQADVRHQAVDRVCRLAPAPDGVRMVPLTAEEQMHPPLSPAQVDEVVSVAHMVEAHFGSPQDMEWTYRDDILYVLQARPISTLRGDDGNPEDAPEGGDGEPMSRVGRSDRGWYLSLHRSFENLLALRERIEGEALPAMAAEADRLAAVDLSTLDMASLKREIEDRRRIRQDWEEVYWRDFIPFAHGMRLFGQVYNDDVRPDDPFEFLQLLRVGDLMSLERNAQLLELARLAGGDATPEGGATGSSDPAVAADRPADAAPDGDVTADRLFIERLDAYLDRFGSGPHAPEEVRRREREQMTGLLESLRSRPAAPSRLDQAAVAEAYLGRFSGEEREFRDQLLDLARASYRLRDDDNLYLDRIQAQLQAALDESARRLGEGPLRPVSGAPPAGPGAEAGATGTPRDPSGAWVRARQLVGQPAGPGLGAGPARVIVDHSDLLSFRDSEVLVCDALDPTMTFVAPLAAAIVERRGGMLIHGAIIAREYGLPCVTGVPLATEVISTGDHVTVDGYLGIIVVAPGTVS